MSLSLRKGVVSFAAVIVGLLGAAVSSGAASSNRAKPSGPCGLPTPAQTRSTFPAAATRRPMLIGAVRVAAGRRAWVVQAPLGRAASYVSQSFTAASGVSVICLLALNDSGTPSYDHHNAAALSALGIPSFACTPDLFPDLMAAAILHQDLALWAAKHELTVARGEQ